MLPRETSIRQLKKLREETKGTDIGDITSQDRLNYSMPNLQYIANPVDTGIESWEDFSKNDSELQTIAFQSKLPNKPLLKKGKQKDFDNRKNESKIVNFTNFDMNEYHSPDYHPAELAPLANLKDIEYIKKKQREKEIEDIEKDNEVEVQNEEEPITEAKKQEETQPKYTILGKEKEPKSNPNFGYAAVRDQEIKKIAYFDNLSPIDPPTPKERPILNAGQFVHTEKVRGYVNRIEGKKVFVESLDEPMKIVEISIKDAVKKPVEPEETIRKFNEISEELNKEYLKNKQ
jgi:hypothetical protein